MVNIELELKAIIDRRIKYLAAGGKNPALFICPELLKQIMLYLYILDLMQETEVSALRLADMPVRLNSHVEGWLIADDKKTVSLAAKERS